MMCVFVTVNFHSFGVHVVYNCYVLSSDDGQCFCVLVMFVGFPKNINKKIISKPMDDVRWVWSERSVTLTRVRVQRVMGVT